MQFAPIDDRFAGCHPKPSGQLQRQLLLATFAAALVLSNAGCSILTSVRNYIAYNDTQNDFVMGFRNGVWARQAWADQRHLFAGQPQLGAFGDGFRAGYVSVASGGNGCPPPVPPRNYWTWKYQTPEGQAKVAAWFAGFPHGARAAEEDQAGEYQDIQVSYAIEQQYSPSFGSGELMQQGDVQPLEPLPNPTLAPALEVPRNDSAHLPPQLFSVPSAMEGIQPSPPAGQPQHMPVVYHQPLPPSPVPPSFVWPQ